MENNKLAIFEGKTIRKVLYEDEWWFSVIDVIGALTGSERSRKYWSDLKKKLIEEGFVEVPEKIGQLKLPALDGKMRKTDCANTETMFYRYPLQWRGLGGGSLLQEESLC